MKVASILTATLLVSILASASTMAAPAKPAAKKPAVKPAAKAPAGGGGSSAAFNSYADAMRNKMAGNWNYPSGHNAVTLTVQVSNDGSVSNMTLTSNPKNTEAEQKANDAFNSAQPLQPLPSGTSAATITCQFNSQADQWDSKANISVKIDPQKSAEPAAAAAGEEKKEENK